MRADARQSIPRGCGYMCERDRTSAAIKPLRARPAPPMRLSAVSAPAAAMGIQLQKSPAAAAAAASLAGQASCRVCVNRAARASRRRGRGRPAVKRRPVPGFPSGFGLLSDSGRGEIRRLLLREKAQIPLLKNRLPNGAPRRRNLRLIQKLYHFPPRKSRRNAFIYMYAPPFLQFADWCCNAGRKYDIIAL